MMQSLLGHLLRQVDRAYDIQSMLTAIPALGPENGGQGELAKAAIIEKLLAASGVEEVLHVNSPDQRVEAGLRPNIIARIHGRCSRTLWLFAHLDVVPPGDGWHTDPWRAHRAGDVIFGRGVEDNQQAATSMLLLAEGLHALGIIPPLGLGLVFMADEECGSNHGLGYILRHERDLFRPDDLYIVPDGGSPDAATIEIAEKAQLWLKFTVHGRQCHASAPQSGVNALVLGSRLIDRLSALPENFPARNGLFDPPGSTFIPTRQEGNGAAINILPGSDTFYMDCRLLPGVDPGAVKTRIQDIIGETVAALDASIDMEVEHFQEATSIPASAAVVSGLKESIMAVYGVMGRPCGIGGATVAALLRKAGLQAAVWSCLQNTCHQPNERSSLSATCKDAAVFGHLLMSAHANA